MTIPKVLEDELNEYGIYFINPSDGTYCHKYYYVRSEFLDLDLKFKSGIHDFLFITGVVYDYHRIFHHSLYQKDMIGLKCSPA